MDLPKQWGFIVEVFHGGVLGSPNCVQLAPNFTSWISSQNACFIQLILKYLRLLIIFSLNGNL